MDALEKRRGGGGGGEEGREVFNLTRTLNITYDLVQRPSPKFIVCENVCCFIIEIAEQK